MVKLMISFAALYNGDTIMFFMVLSLKSAIRSFINCLHPPENKIIKREFILITFYFKFFSKKTLQGKKGLKCHINERILVLKRKRTLKHTHNKSQLELTATKQGTKCFFGLNFHLSCQNDVHNTRFTWVTAEWGHCAFDSIVQYLSPVNATIINPLPYHRASGVNGKPDYNF